METPILFIVFNRPDVTKVLFDTIRQQKPKRLFVAADGARTNKEGEKEKCENVRAIVSNVDWECDVQYLFQPQNLGCKMGVYTAISWFFENVEEGIILEDDCKPDNSFFPFCTELLERYRNNERVMSISAHNPLNVTQHPYSYFYSQFFKVWGWGSWRRAWKHMDVNANSFDLAVKEGFFEKAFGDKNVGKNVHDVNYSVHYQGHDTWDYQWQLSIILQSGLVVVPTQNLMDNIGLDGGAHFGTNANINIDLYRHPVFSMAFPLKHPPFLYADQQYDLQRFYKYNYYLLNKAKPYTFMDRLKDSLKYRLGKVFGINK